MSISRTHLNALVDDDGSNTVGTLWNKARFTEIYDDIDAYIKDRVSPAYAGGNFTGGGSMTVTVDSGDMIAYSYQVTNKQLTIWFELATFTIAGTPNPQMKIAIPGGFTAAGRSWNPIRVSDNGTFKTGVAFVNSGDGVVSCYVDLSTTTNWAASTNNSGVSGSLTFPVN